MTWACGVLAAYLAADPATDPLIEAENKAVETQRYIAQADANLQLARRARDLPELARHAPRTARSAAEGYEQARAVTRLESARSQGPRGRSYLMPPSSVRLA